MPQLHQCLDERSGLDVTCRVSVTMLLALVEGIEKITGKEKGRHVPDCPTL